MGGAYLVVMNGSDYSDMDLFDLCQPQGTNYMIMDQTSVVIGFGQVSGMLNAPYKSVYAYTLDPPRYPILEIYTGM